MPVGAWHEKRPGFPAVFLLHEVVQRSYSGQLCQRSTHFLHCLGLDLPDSLSGNTVFGGEVMQCGGIAFVQPAALDDRPAAVIQADQRVAQTIFLQMGHLRLLQHLGGLSMRVAQVCDGRETIFVIS